MTYVNDRPSLLINVARNKTARQSSTSIWSAPDEAGRPLQGESDAPFSFHTDLDDNPWWSVDLGYVFPVDHLRIFNSRHLPHRAFSLIVEVSSDNIEWEVVHRGFSYFTNQEPLLLWLDGRLDVRFVRLSLPARQYFHLSRIEVLAQAEEARWIATEFDVPTATEGSAREKPVRLGVLGTSNSLSRTGYTATLGASAGIEIVENVSLGSSHSIMAPLRLQTLADADIDVLLIDLCVNEEGSQAAGLFETALSEAALEHLVAWCAEHSCRLMVLITPFQPALIKLLAGDANAAPVRRKYIELCHRLGIAYLDGFALVGRLLDEQNAPIRLAYDDPYHPSGLVQRLFGLVLAQQIQAVILEKQPDIGSEYLAQLVFLPVTIPASGASRLKSRRSAIISIDLMVLQEGCTVDIDVPYTSDIVGVVFNMTETEGLLVFEQAQRAKRLDTAHLNHLALSLATWGMIQAVPITAGRLTLRCEAVGYCIPSERNEHNRSDTRRSKSRPTQIELAGLVLRTPPRQTRFSKLTYQQLDRTRQAVFQTTNDLT